MKNKISILVILLILFTSCTSHDAKKIKLYGFSNQKEVKYEEGNSIFYIGLNDYFEYLNKRAKEKLLSNEDSCIIKYLETIKDKSITISDTTSLHGIRKDIFSDGKDTVLTSINIYPVDNFRWAIIYFAKKGNIKIYNKKKKKFVQNIIVDEIEYSNSAEVVIMLENKVQIFDQLRWAY